MNEQRDQTNSMSGAIAIAHVWALAIQLPMRRLVGKNILGWNAAFSMLFIVFYGGLLGAVPVMAWGAVFFVAAAIHRIATLSRRVQNTETHSYYNGYPLLGHIFKRFDEAPIKGIAEPAVAVVLGILVEPFGDASVMFFFIGAACMVASTLLVEFRHQKRADDMRDAMIESQTTRSRIKTRRW